MINFLLIYQVKYLISVLILDVIRSSLGGKDWENTYETNMRKKHRIMVGRVSFYDFYVLKVNVPKPHLEASEPKWLNPNDIWYGVNSRRF